MKNYLYNVVDANGKACELFMENGRIVKEFTRDNTCRDIDGGGLTVIPGLVDLHTHLREPGREDSETILSGSQSAVAGGFTAISAMPNTSPVADTAGVVEQVFRRGKEHGLCDVYPIGAVTVNSQGKELAEIAAMYESEAQVRIFSDDGNCVSDPLVMRRALEYVKIFDGVIAQHAQDPRLTHDAQMHEGVVSSRLGLKGWPAVAEESIIARDVLLADHVGSRVHICHVSTAGSVEILRWAKKRGIQVTAEVTPHHLLLSDELAESFDPIYKVNPPLRGESDIHALREGLADGTIDVIATDHAPHPMEAKECEWNSAAFGMLGLETALSVAYKAMVESQLISFGELVRRMSEIPAQIGRYAHHGSLDLGQSANFVLIDPKKSWKVNATFLKSKSRNTPFNALELPLSIERTFFQGSEVFAKGKA